MTFSCTRTSVSVGRFRKSAAIRSRRLRITISKKVASKRHPVQGGGIHQLPDSVQVKDGVLESAADVGVEQVFGGGRQGAGCGDIKDFQKEQQGGIGIENLAVCRIGAARELDHLDRLQPGDIVEKPSATRVHQQGMPLQLQQLDREAIFFG